MHDVLDLKVIESGKFVRNEDLFNPAQTLEFIRAMFKAQCKMQGTMINCRAVSVDNIRNY